MAFSYIIHVLGDTPELNMEISVKGIMMAARCIRRFSRVACEQHTRMPIFPVPPSNAVEPAARETAYQRCQALVVV